MIRKILLILIGFLLQYNLLAQKIGWTQTGEGSYYAEKFHGKPTANGERFSIWKYTAAHRTLPFNTVVRVDSHISHLSVVVRINDRGPFARGRIIDLSKVAATKIDMLAGGHHKVTITIVPPNTKLGPVPYKSNGSGNKITPVTPKPVNKDIFKIACNTEHITRPYYGVQICGFEHISNMLPFVEKAKQFSSEVYVDTTKRGDTTIYRICLGKFAERKDAERLKNSLKRKYKGCFVINYAN
ncbi:septal ring lytic transglycosylase RlpA family protein [Halosquirtibacter laminarini]|uniref:Septal ring lytic transglycosylase RlpA family protein n=1 Tax=Halosquirtibacter laminarini TaxID=3374600 RepID=A0AC61NNL8_9BACT|nr:septal ring lytic transglycosylase RlpA family protein [Prolixibacteraceae bacterium]